MLQLASEIIPGAPTPLAATDRYWKAMCLLVVLAAFATPLARNLWDSLPTFRSLIEMIVTRNFEFPPLSYTDTPKQLVRDLE